MAFLINLKPVEIEKVQKKLEKRRIKEAKKMLIPKGTERGIQENPIKRNQFSID